MTVSTEQPECMYIGVFYKTKYATGLMSSFNWKKRLVQIYSNGTLSYSDEDNNKLCRTLDLKKYDGFRLSVDTKPPKKGYHVFHLTCLFGEYKEKSYFFAHSSIEELETFSGIIHNYLNIRRANPIDTLIAKKGNQSTRPPTRKAIVSAPVPELELDTASEISNLSSVESESSIDSPEPTKHQLEQTAKLSSNFENLKLNLLNSLNSSVLPAAKDTSASEGSRPPLPSSEINKLPLPAPDYKKDKTNNEKLIVNKNCIVSDTK